MPLHNTHLRRAYWTVFSESLLQLPYTARYVKDETHRTALLQLFAELDKNPSAVNAHFAALGRMPMGKYFEQLLFYILKHDGRYAIVLQNHQVMDDKVTVGELDLVLRDTKTGITEHWEMALKYYLQSLKSEAHSVMLGPNAIDNLAKKMKKLKGHQLPLAQHPSVQNELAAQNVESKLFLKGQFFYHLNQHELLTSNANPHHEAAWWCFLSEAETMLLPELKYTTIWKPNWIGPTATANDAELFSRSEMLDHLKTHFQQQDHSVLVIGMHQKESAWLETTRGFVVNDNWPHLIPKRG